MVHHNPDQERSEDLQSRGETLPAGMPAWAQNATPEQLKKILYPNRGAADGEFLKENPTHAPEAVQPKKIERHLLYPNLGAEEANENGSVGPWQSVDLQDK